MSRHFALTIHLHDGRYHGADEWPPSPARVFQALVAGAAQGRCVPGAAARALKLLEGVAPVIAAPPARRGQRVPVFVPNNDLDAVEGRPERVGEIRAKKAVWPRLLDGASFIYAWPVPEVDVDELLVLADGLYQFGRGIDLAWAVGEVIDAEQLASRLSTHKGTVHHPTSGVASKELAVPTTNSFESIVARFEAALTRLRPSGDGRMHFVQPPKARFAMVRYDGIPTFHLFELRSDSDPASSVPWATWRATALIERIRHTAVAALTAALPERSDDIQRVLVGRKPNGVNDGPPEERVRFIPLPSIGHAHADQSIRRVLVQIPPGPLPASDILWALGGRQLLDTGGAPGDTTLAASPNDDMVERYCATARIWRSVTPLALGSALRRRIDPSRRVVDAKSAIERQTEEKNARHAIAQALRHAGVYRSIVRVHVQREPFESHGTRVERFAMGTRFAKEALWHAEVEFDREIRGPLVLGDGRFLGLGVMAPKAYRGIFALEVEGGLPATVNTGSLARALRRAVIARVQGLLGTRGLHDVPAYFHGHSPDGQPLRGDRSTHIAFSVDVRGSRLLIVPPHILDGWKTPFRDTMAHLETLEQVFDGFTVLRAGNEGLLTVRVTSLQADDPLLVSSRRFRSLTDYVVSRHAKRLTATEAVVADINRECDRRRLPRPSDVHVLEVHGVAGVGVVARVELTFAVAVRGPLLLGRTRYVGGGLFAPAPDS